MKIVFLDAKTIGDDIDLSAYDTLGEVVKYLFPSRKKYQNAQRMPMYSSSTRSVSTRPLSDVPTI